MSSDCSIEVDGIRSAEIARFLSSSLGMNSLPMNWNATADSANTPTPIPIVAHGLRSEEHTSELQSLMRISYAVFCLKKTKKNTHITISESDKLQLQITLYKKD